MASVIGLTLPALISRLKANCFTIMNLPSCSLPRKFVQTTFEMNTDCLPYACVIVWLTGALAKQRKMTSFCHVLSPFGVTTLHLDGFSLYLVFEYLSKICH